MITVLIILEALAVFCLALFSGILNSKYYEKLSMRIVSRYEQCPVWLFVLTVYVSAMAQYYTQIAWLSPLVVFTHAVLHATLALLIIVALIKFETIQFKYTRQYLLSRASLYFAVVFEVIALGAFTVCCVKYF